MLDRIHEVERFGHIAADKSKQYSEQLTQTISLITPPEEINSGINSLESQLTKKRSERKNKIKNLKSSKANAKAREEKKSLQQRLASFFGDELLEINVILQSLNHPDYARPLSCCPYLSCRVGCTFWPKVNQEDEKNCLEESLELVCRFFEQKTKLTGFRYKLSAKSKKLSAFQMIYTHGVKSTLLKAQNETEEGMITVNLKKNQQVAKIFHKRINQATQEIIFIDQFDNEIIKLPYHGQQLSEKYRQMLKFSLKSNI